MTAAQQKTHSDKPLSFPQTASPEIRDALEEAGGWYFDADRGALKAFALSLDACAPDGIARLFAALDLASYDAATCRLAVWLFDRAMPLQQKKRLPAAPRKRQQKRRQKRQKTGQGAPPRALWPSSERCAPSCL